MANTYRTLSKAAQAAFSMSPFDAEFTVVEERDWLAAGHLEIVPRPYRVLSNNFAAGGMGEVVELALPIETEAALLAGGHLERVDKPAAKKAVTAAEKKD